MTEKSWMQQDFILYGFTRGRFITLIVVAIAILILYTLLWYGIGLGVGTGWFKRMFWKWLWWLKLW